MILLRSQTHRHCSIWKSPWRLHVSLLLWKPSCLQTPEISWLRVFHWALLKLLLLTFFPKPRWWNADLNGVMVTIRSRNPSRLDNWPNRRTIRWFQQVKLFTYLLPSYFFTNHLKWSVGRKSHSWENTYRPLFISICFQIVICRKILVSKVGSLFYLL